MEALKLVQKREVPELLGISRSTLANWLNRRSPYFKQDFPEAIRLGERLSGFRLTDLEQWLDRNNGRKSTTAKNIASDEDPREIHLRLAGEQ